jgi:phenylacetate-CoA ligase
MIIYDLETVLKTAREKSAYYRNLYKDVPEGAPITDYPLVESDDFWQAARKDGGAGLLTDRQVDGRVFKSGGTTGTPKFSPYTTEEWSTMCELLSENNALQNLSYGDHVGNLFYSGNLYASYDFITTMHMCAPVKYVLYNLGGHAKMPDIVENVQTGRINVLAGLPSILIKLAEYIEENHISNLPVEKICFAGESLQMSQRDYMDRVYGRRLSYFSFGLAGNDYGMVAYFSSDCGFNEHHADDRACYFEIIDPDTGEIIHEENRIGRIYITSRHKLLMPIIRYPIGDMGMYTEPEGVRNRRFKLMGRNSEMARVGIVNLFRADFDRVIERTKLPVKAYQLIITHNDETRRDKLTVLLDASEPVEDQFRQAIYEECPMLLDTEQKEMIDRTEIKRVSSSEMTFNPRTGKMPVIIDRRFS